MGRAAFFPHDDCSSSWEKEGESREETSQSLDFARSIRSAGRKCKILNNSATSSLLEESEEDKKGARAVFLI